MIKKKEILHEWIQFEVEEYRKIGYKGKILSFLAKSEIGQIVNYSISLRKDEYYSNTQNKSLLHLFFHFYWRRKHNKIGEKLGISIPINTFKKGLVIYHAHGIIIHKDVRCGYNCKLHGFNCIGNNGNVKNYGLPVLGNNIDIGVGASIIGNITLADGIKVGAGAVVCESFNNPNSVLVGIPAREK